MPLFLTSPLLPFMLFILCAITLLGQWRVYRDWPWWPPILILALLVAAHQGALDPVGALWLGLYALLAWSVKQGKWKSVGLAGLVLMGFALAIGALPGFHSLPLLPQTLISADAVPYAIGINVPKMVVGLLVLWAVFDVAQRGLLSRAQWRSLALPVLITVTVTLALSQLSLIHWDPKWHTYLLVFALHNLFFTALAEEAFFRGLVHQPLCRWGAYPAMVTSAILFGLAHYGMGRWDYVAVACVAGFGYAWVYQHSGRVLSSMLTHWLLNVCHFVFFTYPFLA